MDRDMTQASEMAMNVGELKGQMSEALHAINNLRQEIKALAHQLQTTTLSPADLVDLKATITVIEARVTALEHSNTRLTSERGMVSWLLKSPVAWVVAAAAAAVTWFKGGLQ